MDTFEPLIELRGEWRQAAAISVPAAAAQVAAALDRALDVLVDADQVDDESLTMAAETVCKAVIARSDEVELLRRRLLRAIRDFVTVTAIDDAPMSTDGGAFESEEALAAALFASVGEAIGVDDEVAEEAPRTAGGRRIDEKALKKKLSNEPGRTRRRVLNFVKLAIPLGLVAGALVVVLLHPEWFVHTVSGPSGPSASATATNSLNCPPSQTQNGCFQGTDAACPGGTSGVATCDFTFTVTRAGAISLTVHWDTSDKLTVALMQADGKTVVGAPAQGSDGKVTLTLPNVASGTYTLRITNPAHSDNIIHFNVSTP